MTKWKWHSRQPLPCNYQEIWYLFRLWTKVNTREIKSNKVTSFCRITDRLFRISVDQCLILLKTVSQVHMVTIKCRKETAVKKGYVCCIKNLWILSVFKKKFRSVQSVPFLVYTKDIPLQPLGISKVKEATGSEKFQQ